MITYPLARLTADPTKRVRRLYAVYPPSCLTVGRTTSYMNMGYWDHDCQSTDEASETLAAQLAKAADFTPGDKILDVGFGYGDQDFSWLRDHAPAQICGLNITPRQVLAAQHRARREGANDRNSFRHGSATQIPFGADKFDRVVALDCAFHFAPRSAFSAEAFRVLRPGGVLATADLLPLRPGTSLSDLRSAALSWLPMSVPAGNWYCADSYAEKLAATGFSQISVESIRDHVYEPWRQDVLRKLDDPQFQRSIGQAYQRWLNRRWADQAELKREMASLDYVLAVARKPEQATPGSPG